jgi:uncharacterized protein (TIGR03000 family)
MYHKIIGLGGTLFLGVAALLWMAAPVLARGGGGHGGGGHGGGGHGGFGGGHGGFGGGHSGGWHDGWGHHGGYGGWGHRGGYGGWYGGYYPGYYSYYPDTDYGAYYDSENYPDYSYSPFYGYGNYQYGSDSGSVSGYSSGASTAPVIQDDTARVKVLVPAEAQVWIDNQPTRAKGSERDFVSPRLEPTRNYTYDIRARWNEGGHEVEQTRTAEVRAGGETTVDFRASAPNQRQTPARTGTSGS